MSKTFNPENRPTCGDDKGRWLELPDGRYQCPNCQTIRDTPRRRICRTESEQQAAHRAALAEKAKHRPPPGPPQKPKPPRQRFTPTLPVRTARWAIAMASWLRESWRAGRWLIRPEAEYHRVRRICEGCEKWEPAKQQCSVCGCGGRSKVVLLNKLKIETEKCPQGKW